MSKKGMKSRKLIKFFKITDETDTSLKEHESNINIFFKQEVGVIHFAETFKQKANGIPYLLIIYTPPKENKK